MCIDADLPVTKVAAVVCSPVLKFMSLQPLQSQPWFSQPSRHAGRMDAASYLKKQGWRGTGHSLDQTDRGLKRALGISKKVDALGVGIQKYGAVSDQWWMRAYDQGLKDLGTGKEGELDKVRKHGHDRGGLYARFVKGQPIPGTIDEYIETTEPIPTTTETTSKPRSKKRGLPVDESNVKSRKEEEPVIDVRTSVSAFVDEAIARGIIPAKGSKKSNTCPSNRPSDADMQRVLALAGLSTTSSKDKSCRQHMVRALKRAAMQHIETPINPP